MSEVTTLTILRGASLVPIILAGLWFVITGKDADAFVTLLSVAIVCAIVYAILTGVGMLGNN